MLAKYLYVAWVYYKGVCVWKEVVTKKTCYSLYHLVAAMQRVDSNWAIDVEELR